MLNIPIQSETFLQGKKNILIKAGSRSHRVGQTREVNVFYIKSEDETDDGIFERANKDVLDLKNRKIIFNNNTVNYFKKYFKNNNDIINEINKYYLNYNYIINNNLNKIEFFINNDDIEVFDYNNYFIIENRNNDNIIFENNEDTLFDNEDFNVLTQDNNEESIEDNDENNKKETITKDNKFNNDKEYLIKEFEKLKKENINLNETLYQNYNIWLKGQKIKSKNKYKHHHNKYFDLNQKIKDGENFKIIETNPEIILNDLDVTFKLKSNKEYYNNNFYIRNNNEIERFECTCKDWNLYNTFIKKPLNNCNVKYICKHILYSFNYFIENYEKYYIENIQINSIINDENNLLSNDINKEIDLINKENKNKRKMDVIKDLDENKISKKKKFNNLYIYDNEKDEEDLDNDEEYFTFLKKKKNQLN
jgi:hypothetical protein